MAAPTPSIRISHPRRSTPPTHPAPTHNAAPMAIPKAKEPVPPPLPPPTFIPDISAGHDPGWQWGNHPSRSDFGQPASVRPGSSLLGSSLPFSAQQKEQSNPRPTSSESGRSESSATYLEDRRGWADSERRRMGSQHDDDTASNWAASNYRLQSENQLGQRTLEESSNSYDKQLLSRIGGPNAPKRLSVAYSPAHTEAPSPPYLPEHERRAPQLRLFQLPERGHVPPTAADSPACVRWPTSAAVSPGGFWPESGAADVGRGPPTRRGSALFDDGHSHKGSYDESMFINEDLMEDDNIGSLRIHDRSPAGSDDLPLKTGTKRRASSPPRDSGRAERSSVSSVSGHGDHPQRRTLPPGQHSPNARVHPDHSSASSVSSLGHRHGSLGSSLGISSVPSSATSFGSGRLSPSAPFPAVDPSARLGSPYESTKALPTAHQRTCSESTQGGRKLSSTDSMAHSRHGSLSQMQGAFMCDCCPKKPKKFDTQDELRLHQEEKQYSCAYCTNRFKNKNEAERHQNSLHLRKHSWSCAALPGPEAAFHQTSANGADVCGFCGEEFSNPPQWDIRAEHLNQVHKFGECNQAKKFFRADHFRQHLKHSHAGTSGKWTNLLEAACVRDEPPPEKRADAGAYHASMPGGQAPPALMVTTSGLGQPMPGNHGSMHDG